MRPRTTSGAGAGYRALAEILGSQAAWWNLGFRIRRAVVRDARNGIPFPDQDVWEVALSWARQWLTAPRWWRMSRTGGSTVLLVVFLAGLIAALGEVDVLVTLCGAVAGCLPAAAAWSWRQARDARAVLALAPEPRPGPTRTRRMALHATVVLAAASASASTMVLAIANERSVDYDCPDFSVEAPVREWWHRQGGRSEVGCPTGDTRTTDGVRHTPWMLTTDTQPDHVVYVSPSVGPVTIPLAVFTAWIATGGPSGPLGEVTEDGDWNDTPFVNFDGGAITLTTDGDPLVQLGQRHAVARDVDDPCVARDRPCITTAYTDAEGLHLAWWYGAADTFNVSWERTGGGSPSTGSREVAGYGTTFHGVTTPGTYVIRMQACDKRFLRRSHCTWPPDQVLVEVG